MIPEFVKQREENGEPFDLYFAGSQSSLTETWMLENGTCRLQSQLNDRTNIKKWCEHEGHGKLFIDSGAYTAFTLHKKIDIEEYISYINSISENLTCFAQVDFIPGNVEESRKAPQLSWDNYLYMRSKVKEPNKLIPIYHQSEHWDWLRNMLSYRDENGEQLKYIGFGALVGASSVQRNNFFSTAFSIIEESDNPNIKVHAMGMTSLPLLEMFPFYSADSTGWIMTGASGIIMTPWGHIDVSEKGKYLKTHLTNIPNKEVVIEWLDKNGLTVEELCSDYKKRMLCNLIYLTEWAKNYKYKGSNISARKKLF